MSKIHIGERIKEEIYSRGISVSVFARRINRSRNGIYDLFTRRTIDVELLYEVCKALNTNFFEVYYLQINEKLRIAKLESDPEAIQIYNEEKVKEEAKKMYLLKLLQMQEDTVKVMRECL